MTLSDQSAGVGESRREDMPAPPSSASGVSGARPLIPKSLEFLIRERHLLWHENAEEYDALRTEIFSEKVPEGALEAILLKNLVDVLWEARRLRRLKAHAIHDDMPEAASRMLVEQGSSWAVSRRRDRFEAIAQAAAIGAEIDLTEGEEGLEEALENKYGTAEMLHYRTLNDMSEHLERLDRLVERVENRFLSLLRQFEARRTGMTAMARSLMDRERAQVIDVPPGAKG